VLPAKGVQRLQAFYAARNYGCCDTRRVCWWADLLRLTLQHRRGGGANGAAWWVNDAPRATAFRQLFCRIWRFLPSWLSLVFLWAIWDIYIESSAQVTVKIMKAKMAKSAWAKQTARKKKKSEVDAAGVRLLAGRVVRCVLHSICSE